MTIGDVGTAIVCNVDIDVSSATVLWIKYRKPQSGNTGYWTATHHASGKIKYITTRPTDVDEAGEWWVQPYVETPSWKRHGARGILMVGGYVEVLVRPGTVTAMGRGLLGTVEGQVA